MKQGDSRGVGICLGISGVVIALARPQPSRVVGIATVSWPHGLWQHPGPESGPAAVARRMLRRARRQLALPRWHPVSVVIGPNLGVHTPEEVLATSAELLARAGLSQAWVAAPGGAEALWRQMAVGPGPLGAAAAGEEAGLAIGAALASLFPPSAPATVPHGPAQVPPAPAEVMPIAAMPPASPEVMPIAAMPPPASAEVKQVAAMPPASPEVMPIAAMPPASAEVKPVAAMAPASPEEMPIAAMPPASPEVMPIALMPPAPAVVMPIALMPIAAMPPEPAEAMPAVAPEASGDGPVPAPVSDVRRRGWALQRIGGGDGQPGYAMIGPRE